MAPEWPPATEPGEAARVREAADTGASALALERLARDPAVTVRAALAMNPAAPAPLFSVIAHDSDDRVRALLARRLAALLPSLADRQLDRLRDSAMATLMGLVNDEAVRVRAAIADVVKTMPKAPRDLVLRLAHDRAISVAEPVITLSPLLSCEDLLELIAASPATATAVARRPGLAERVSDTIANGDDPAAIRALLSNRHAAIREATLDQLISRAAAHVDWHQPLVRQPRLSARASRALSEMVTAQLLGELMQRTDLPADLAAELQERLNVPAEPPPAKGKPPTIAEAMQIAQDMAAAKSLDEDSLILAARRGEARLCTAILAVAAEVEASVVDRACTLRSAKGILSLIWRAGFTMRCAAPLQTLLVRLPPDSIMRATEGEEFPLSLAEMRWQIEFLTRIGR